MRIIILLLFFAISSCNSLKFTQKNKVLELEHGEYLDKKVADKLFRLMTEITDIAYERYNV